MEERHFMQRARPVQRPWGRIRPGSLEEQRRGHLAGAEWGREKEGEGEGREGRGLVVQGLGTRRGLGTLTPGRWEPWRVVGCGTPDPGPHRYPLAATVAGTDCGGQGQAGPRWREGHL